MGLAPVYLTLTLCCGPPPLQATFDAASSPSNGALLAAYNLAQLHLGGHTGAQGGCPVAVALLKRVAEKGFPAQQEANEDFAAGDYEWALLNYLKARPGALLHKCVVALCRGLMCSSVLCVVVLAASTCPLSVLVTRPWVNPPALLQAAEMGLALGQANAAWMLTEGYGYEGACVFPPRP